MVKIMNINLYTWILIIIVSLNIVDSKRSFSIGRSRKKVANPNVRRKNGGPERPPSAPENSPVGPPPAYPGHGNNPVNPNGAPPAYSPSNINPPSYASAIGSPSNTYYPRQTYDTNYAYGFGGSSNIGKIPPRGAPGQSMPDATSFYGIGYGHNAHGLPAQSARGLYNNNGMGGFSGLGNYGSGYGYGQRSSSPFSFGNILTGLAVWNIARGFNSYGRTQHIYIHDNRTDGNSEAIDPNVLNSNILATPVENNEEQNPEEISVDSTTSFDYVENITELATPRPTIHPSLMTYASGSRSIKQFVEVHNNNATSIV